MNLIDVQNTLFTHREAGFHPHAFYIDPQSWLTVRAEAANAARAQGDLRPGELLHFYLGPEPNTLIRPWEWDNEPDTFGASHIGPDFIGYKWRGDGSRPTPTTSARDITQEATVR